MIVRVIGRINKIKEGNKGNTVLQSVSDRREYRQRCRGEQANASRYRGGRGGDEMNTHLHFVDFRPP